MTDVHPSSHERSSLDRPLVAVAAVDRGPTGDPYQQLRSSLEALRHQVVGHPVFTELNDLAAVRIFMTYHAPAVWDFMVLLNRLQSHYCSVGSGWTMPRDTRLARVMNEIKLAEESDVDAEGHPASHVELYLRAMHALGADSSGLEALAQSGSTRPRWMAGTPQPARRFVETTLELAQGSIGAAVGAFAFGRELLIPDMFSSIADRRDYGPFGYYLARHIELDGGSHGPAARQLVEDVTRDAAGYAECARGARRALEARRDLWDATLTAITQGRQLAPSASM